MAGHGCERRKNWRLRQLINCAYGLSLAVTGSSALAAGTVPKLLIKPQAGVHDDAMPAAGQQARAYRLVFLRLEPRDLLASTGQALPVWDHRHPWNQPLLKALDRLDPDDLRFDEHPLREIRNGLGFDFELPQSGNLHLNLYTNRQADSRGYRIDMRPLDGQQAGQRKLWSLGASLDSTRTADGRDIVSLVPQLVLDLDGLLDQQGRLQARIEYGNWQPLRQELTMCARVAQLSLRLEF